MKLSLLRVPSKRALTSSAFKFARISSKISFKCGLKFLKFGKLILNPLLLFISLLFLTNRSFLELNIFELLLSFVLLIFKSVSKSAAFSIQYK